MRNKNCKALTVSEIRVFRICAMWIAVVSAFLLLQREIVLPLLLGISSATKNVPDSATLLQCIVAILQGVFLLAVILMIIYYLVFRNRQWLLSLLLFSVALSVTVGLMRLIDAVHFAGRADMVTLVSGTKLAAASLFLLFGPRVKNEERGDTRD